VHLMLRPEQIRISDGGPIRGTVLETDFFGPEVTVRLELHGPQDAKGNRQRGETITIRHWNATLAKPGSELFLRVIGEGVAFPA
jgi:iron(III) transport system ATP-binding protein